MLEHVPQWLGALFHNFRAGHSKLAIVRAGLVPEGAFIDLSSPAFENGARLPARFTADGEGISPPLEWGEVPAATTSLALLVEDPDAPAAEPLVHAIVWNLPAGTRAIPEGGIGPDDDGAPDGRDVGRNSYQAEGWLPPDPPPGHGTHDYVFQLFALSRAPMLETNPGRSEFLAAIKDHVLAAGMLVGHYARGEGEPADEE
ncbi:MAG: YbhB/YbcL family Raf kinase inhibitor-like protein [Novosphingobium sp.]|uniref:YbhB/YbcL family Raf kinase inhibitor-like protein n=1 Tax=Novosphingobium sp. TaxID=1874826 RepID=UPI0012C344E2|nr:YbhB/YbcL family Raf kinase inhibitor-like protein [Novosphingobium sp.]MPS68007.1 YbhB/YbcL family Raf kinase inhibitor-like protein [Novosphingobium sp.]